MAASLSPRPQQVVVTHALRTPIGRFLGAFADLTAADLGASVVADLLRRSSIEPASVGELLFGNARQAGGGPNVARQIAIRGGLPESLPAWTINMACGSGLKAIALAGESILSGSNEVVIAGGTESMSGLPFFLPRMRRGYRLGHAEVVDGMYRDGFMCPMAEMLMGETAEKLARELEIGREEQDAFALDSQHKCQSAVEAGRFEAEISAVTVTDRKGVATQVMVDEHPRPQTNLEALGKLRPVFDAEHGTVTAGNSSGITDGASAVLMMSAERAHDLGLEPLAYLGETAQAGVDPKVMGIGPVPAVEELGRRSGQGPGDFDLIELNEAFAAQVLACDRKLGLPMDRVNVNGGSIALGHPIGATGTRITVTLLHELARRDAEHGLATLCISGGMGLATAFHRTGLR